MIAFLWGPDVAAGLPTFQFAQSLRLHLHSAIPPGGISFEPPDYHTYLSSVPVGAIVLDRTSANIPNLHQPLLEQAIAAHPQTWTLVGVFPANPVER